MAGVRSTQSGADGAYKSPLGESLEGGDEGRDDAGSTGFCRVPLTAMLPCRLSTFLNCGRSASIIVLYGRTNIVHPNPGNHAL